MKRILKIAGITIAAVLLIAVALPFVIDVNSFRPKLEAEASSAVGRQVKVGNLSLSILSGSVSAHDITIADDPAFSKDPFLRAQSLDVGVELLPLIFSKVLHVTNIELKKPEIVLLHAADGRWNFSSMGANSRPTSAAQASASGSSQPTNFSVGKLKVKEGRISVDQVNSSRPPHVYDNVKIEVHNFSFASQFPFTLAADLPGGGTMALDGTAGPINPNDAAATPLQAKMAVKHLDLAASGFVEPSTGISGFADFQGNVISDGHLLHTRGTLNAEKLKVAQKGSPAGRPVQVKYAVDHDLQKRAGTLTEGEISMGRAVAKLTGNYWLRGDSTSLNMKLNAPGMPVDDLEAMLPAVGVVLPSGSQLKGGTLSTALAIQGPTDKPVITGPIRLADSQLAGFDLGSKLSAISAFSGANTGSNTAIQILSTDTRVAPDGVRTDNINLIIPALGVLTGSGTISPSGALNYKMTANLSGGAVGGLTQIAGVSNRMGSIPFFIQGTTSNPKFVPDVQGMMSGQLKSRLPANDTGNRSPFDAIKGMFGRKKKPPK